MGAKAYAEKHFRNMVIDNNKVCSRCRLGKEKIAKRRLEIDGAIKQENKLKAQREAEKRRQSRGRGGRRAGLAQESLPSSTIVTEPIAVPTSIAQTTPITPISVAQETKVENKKHSKKSHKKQKKVEESEEEK